MIFKALLVLLSIKLDNYFRRCTENEVKNGGFESGDLTDWTVLTDGFDASNAVVNARTYWAQELPYNQSGFYHLNGWNTGIPEEQSWAVRSSSFVLGGSGYISVKMGGNAAVTKVFLSDGTEIGYYRNFRFHDVSFPYIAQGGAWADMATYVIDLSDYLGKEMYLELHDEVITDGWANAFFDDVVTYYEAAPNVSQRCDKVPDGHNPGETARLTQIPWLLFPKVSTEAEKQIPNGNFETGDLTGWTVYGSGFPIKNGLPAANSDETYWEQELPYNKSGNYFLNGSALSSNEANTWRVRSTPFTLEGSGWISVKMGGHAAAVRVYRMDGTLVGDFDQGRFRDKDFPYLSKGGSWNDMATYLLDLTPNIGEVLYIELCDISINGGWANAFFDDVVTYYRTKPSTDRRQQVTDGHKPGENAKTVWIPTVIGVNNVYNPRNGGFELGDLTGWTTNTKGFRTSTAVISAEDYDLDNVVDGHPIARNRLPYNQSGNFHLSGRDVGMEEVDTWELYSSPFTLAGSGYISLKMGGSSAAFRVRTAEDNKIIAYCQQRRYNDVNFPHISEGGSWWDMATYVMDLSPYLGQKLVIELMDEEVDAGWAHAFFDDVVTYYPKRPTARLDRVIDGYDLFSEEEKSINIPWIFLDAFEDLYGRFPPPVAVLKDISGEVKAQSSFNLFNFFITQQGLSDYVLLESTLSITGVIYYDSDGMASWVSGDYGNLQLKPGRYVVGYKLKQVGRTHTGTFEILVWPTTPSNKLFNGGFELGKLVGWTPLTDGFNKDTAVISAQTYWEPKLPYNQAGNYHLDGWNTGITDESAPWSVKSSNFILDGSGYISWRMGGNSAAFSVHTADGTEIARVSESRFRDGPFYPNVNEGHWADMATYVMDLSEFLGDELYVVLHDEEITEGWAHAFFDEVVTYYPVAPKPGRKDTVWNSDGCTPEKVDFPWIFVETPTNFRFSGEPSNDTHPAGTDVDLTQKLTGTTATYKGQPADIQITKVKFGNTTYTSGFDSFDMSAPGMYQIFYQATRDGKKSVEKSFTLEAYNSYMVPNGGFETGDLTGWTVTRPASGFAADKKPVISDETYWDSKKMPYNQAGNYHLGGVVEHTGIAEDDAWTVKSATFTLGGSGYISWRMGGNAAAVKVCTADGTQVGYYKNEQFKEGGGIEFGNVDQGAWFDMRTHVVDLSSYKEQQMYIELCDVGNADGGWAQATFDEIVTYYPQAPAAGQKDTVQNSTGCTPATAELPWIYLDRPTLPFQFTGEPSNGILPASESPVNLNEKLIGTTATYGGQAADIAITRVERDGTAQNGDFAQFNMSKPGVYRIFYQATRNGESSDEKSFALAVYDNNTIPNGGFETGDLTGWTVTNPVSGFAADKKPVINAPTYWDQEIPYNQAGNYHLNGYDTNTGIAEKDTWSVKSANFTLDGSDCISWRMGGKAAVFKVFLANGTEIASVEREPDFNDNGNAFGNVKYGSWNDMHTYVLDLSAYHGQEMYVELHDADVVGTWANAFFDEIVTYYQTAPQSDRKDTVQNSVGCEPETVDFPWIFVNGPALSFQFTGEPSNGTLLAAANVDLTAKLNGTTATYGGQAAAIAITKVEFNGTAQNGNYASFDMSASGVYKVFYQAACEGKASEEKSFILAVHTADTIPNGGFETGDLTGWTTSSTGFNKDTAVISKQTYWNEKRPYNQAGDYHLNGESACGEGEVNEAKNWAVKSETFTLGGSGWISVRMGGNAAAVKVYKVGADGAGDSLVGYYRQTRFNDNGPGNVSVGSWNDMGTYVMDLSDLTGEKLYIELCDEAVTSGGWAHAFFDEVVTCYETAPNWGSKSDTVANTTGQNPPSVELRWTLATNLAGLEEPPEPTTPMQITNGGFETGDLTGWTVLTGTSGTDFKLSQATTYWNGTNAGENRPYNQAGSWHLDGFPPDENPGEARTWSIQSSIFKLAGSGYISVRMGGNAAKVNVCKEDGTVVASYKPVFKDDNSGGTGNVAVGAWNEMRT